MYTLIYKSKMAPDLTHDRIRSMLYRARDFNKKNNISGCIFYGNSRFLQMIEGEKDKILELYNQRIKKDIRHHSVELLLNEKTPKRLFKEWSMVFFNIKLFEDFKNDEENFIKAVLVDCFEDDTETSSIKVLKKNVNDLVEDSNTNLI